MCSTSEYCQDNNYNPENYEISKPQVVDRSKLSTEEDKEEPEEPEQE